jgi:SWI/SNF-related matrix-associated actin-dependent regulator of chromatin subfamily A-like protein 1
LELASHISDVSILERKALDLLDKYEGANNYILRLKQKMMTNPKFYPTRAQSEYIINFHKSVPKVAKKWVELDSYFAQRIADDKLFTKVPEKVYVEKLLVEKDTSYHIWGKFFESESIHDFWLPKVALMKDNTVKNVVIEYSKYSNRPPLEHQKESIQKLCENKKFILADDMGLGKTTSTIIAALETGAKKVLIVCPASLKINWQREIENYSDRTISIIDGKKWEDADFVIINYDIIKNFHDEKNKKESVLLNSKFDLMVIDEAHYIQNKQAQRTKLINDFAKNIERLWLLTGTPITSRPINYFNLLNLIESPVALNWMAYVKRYCNGYQFKAGRRKVWNVSGASNLEELRDRTAPLVLRRLKENVLDLPDKIITPVYLRLKSKEYESLMGDYYAWYDKGGEANSMTLQFTKLTQVRQCISQEKVSSTIELCENIIEQGKKVIVFTNFTRSLEMILEHFGKKAVRLDGSMSQKDRQVSVDRFQNDENVMVFVGNIKAAGTGLTLTAGEAVVMNDLSFLPSDHSQAEDRAYRFGQKNNVLVYYPIYENTIEGIIYDILKKKKEIFETVMGDNVGQTDFVEDILSSINNMRR